jgi:hypothetical protein
LSFCEKAVKIADNYAARTMLKRLEWDWRSFKELRIGYRHRTIDMLVRHGLAERKWFSGADYFRITVSGNAVLMALDDNVITSGGCKFATRQSRAELARYAQTYL